MKTSDEKRIENSSGKNNNVVKETHFADREFENHLNRHELKRGKKMTQKL